MWSKTRMLDFHYLSWDHISKCPKKKTHTVWSFFRSLFSVLFIRVPMLAWINNYTVETKRNSCFSANWLYKWSRLTPLPNDITHLRCTTAERLWMEAASFRCLSSDRHMKSPWTSTFATLLFFQDVFSVDSWNNFKDHFIEIKDSQLALKPKEKKIPIKPQRDNEGGFVDGSNRTGWKARPSWMPTPC